MKRIILTFSLIILATAAIAQEVPKDDDQSRSDAQARMEAAARARQIAATQASTNPSATTHKAPVYPDVQTILADLPANLQPKSTGWDAASIAKARPWIHSHLLGRTVRQQAVMVSRTSVKVAAESNPNDVLHWEIIMVFKPDKPTLFGFENWIQLKTRSQDLTVFGRKIVDAMLAKTPDQPLIIFVVDNKMSKECEKWNEGDLVNFDAEVDDITITQSKGEKPDHGNILVSFARCHPIPSMAK